MNYIKEAENYLYYYNDLKISIENMERQREKLIKINGPKEIKSVQLDITGGGKKQDEAINVLYKIQELTRNIKETELRLEDINDILKKFDESKETILRMWYIDGEKKEDIADKLHCTERHLYRVKDAAIRKFAIHILGINALSVI